MVWQVDKEQVMIDIARLKQLNKNLQDAKTDAEKQAALTTVVKELERVNSLLNGVLIGLRSRNL